MDTQAAWQLFLSTGAPEAYLLYKQTRKLEEGNVPDDSRPGYPGHSLQ